MLQHPEMSSVILSFVSNSEAKELDSSSQLSANNNTASSDSTSGISSTSSNSNGQCVNKNDIYVCTFCQVFSFHLTTVTSHVSTVHADSLPPGTKPENFVSKLQSLEGNNLKKKSKVGRPRKKQAESVVSLKQKEKIVDPIPDSEGLFWCKVCLRHFRKSRQLIQHICLEDPENEVSSEESPFEMEDDVEFKKHMNIDPVPWSRNKKRKLKENFANTLNSETEASESSVTEAKRDEAENKLIPNWRNDPTYIPLFDDDEEKAAFEEHLRSIDYSYVDTLFTIEEKRCRNKGKNNCLHVQSTIYSCNFCKKDFKSLSLVRPHCLTHTDLKPFTCPKCPYRSNSSGSLYMHMRKHTGNVFSCSYCDFKSIKRSHLLDHEATHSTVYQICKLCKNSYKTVRSLVAHVRKYHSYANGRKYLKSLTCKQSKEFKCDICSKKFKSQLILNNHNHVCHEMVTANNEILEENISNQNSEKANNLVDDPKIDIANTVELPSTDIQCNSMQAKTDPLAEIVINNFLQQQQQTQAIMYHNVFSDTNETIASQPNTNLLNDFQAENLTTDSILEECQKTLDLHILKECLQNSGFSNECQNFSLMPNLSRKNSLQTNDSENTTDVASHLDEMSCDKLEEPKSVEIKLFEKCQRAPAYVCCVCSAIYICPSTLKAHLREHVNSTSSSFIDQAEEQHFEPTKLTENSDELDVSQILQDSSESCSYDEELEKLYTSSLDMMYYLPEVSVVLENDPALFDAVLEDISSNFPISDSANQSLSEKDEDESVLKCFSEM